MLTPQMIKKVTEDFYSQFCGISLAEIKNGAHFICSPERDKELRGFGCKYTLYVLEKEDFCVVCYSPKHKKLVEQWKECDRNEILLAANQHFQLTKKKLMIFEKEVMDSYGNAKILKASDYPLYEAFFHSIHPNANTDGWLEEYFIEKTEKEYFAGYLSENKLVSVCDAPDMPYMEDRIQHTGINTLAEERRKGYAACTAALAAHHLIENGVCPQWECDVENTASINLAKAIGYQEYGTAYILEEWD